MRHEQDSIYFDVLGQYHYGVLIYDLDKKRFTYLNPAFAEIFRTDKNSLTEDPRLVFKHISPEDFTYLENKFEELLAGGSFETTEFRLLFAGQEPVHISCDAFPIHNNRAFAGFVKDVTREKEHENYIIEITAQKDALLDMITHNLSGPLVLSQNILGWLQRSIDANQTADLNPLLQMLQESTQQCMDIVNDFLNEEHKDSQEIVVRKTRFNIVEKVNMVVDKMKEFTPNLEFRKNFLIKNVLVNTDSVKFFQVVNNLLSNAIKFTGEKGVITVSLNEDKTSFLFGVEDNGIGIPEALQPYIFDKRTKAGRAGLQGERSNGVGLSITRKLVELIGGEIWFESNENKGSTFYVRLPKDS